MDLLMMTIGVDMAEELPGGVRDKLWLWYTGTSTIDAIV